MNDKPVIVSINASNPSVVSEFEGQVDGILMNSNKQNPAIHDLISGDANPYGLLLFQMPKDMETVEKQKKDLAHDMIVHVDTEGHAYDFAFALDFTEIINDQRTKLYKR